MEEEGLNGGFDRKKFCIPTIKLFLDQYDKLKTLESQLHNKKIEFTVNKDIKGIPQLEK